MIATNFKNKYCTLISRHCIFNGRSEQYFIKFFRSPECKGREAKTALCESLSPDFSLRLGGLESRRVFTNGGEAQSQDFKQSREGLPFTHTVLNTLNEFTSFKPTRTLQGEHCYNPHFTNWETEAQSGCVSCWPRSSARSSTRKWHLEISLQILRVGALNTNPLLPPCWPLMVAYWLMGHLGEKVLFYNNYGDVNWLLSPFC